MGVELGVPDSSLRKTPRLGNSRKAGDLKRLAGACINGGACGLIRQYTGNLTSRRCPSSVIICISSRVGGHRGAAWLSSVRVVRCGIELPNERNPHSLRLTLSRLLFRWLAPTAGYSRGLVNGKLKRTQVVGGALRPRI